MICAARSVAILLVSTCLMLHSTMGQLPDLPTANQSLQLKRQTKRLPRSSYSVRKKRAANVARKGAAVPDAENGNRSRSGQKVEETVEDDAFLDPNDDGDWESGPVEPVPPVEPLPLPISTSLPDGMQVPLFYIPDISVTGRPREPTEADEAPRTTTIPKPRKLKRFTPPPKWNPEDVTSGDKYEYWHPMMSPGGRPVHAGGGMAIRLYDRYLNGGYGRTDVDALFMEKMMGISSEEIKFLLERQRANANSDSGPDEAEKRRVRSKVMEIPTIR